MATKKKPDLTLPRLPHPAREGMCRWFLLCDRPATTTVKHTILGDVPTCERCAERARRGF